MTQINIMMMTEEAYRTLQKNTDDVCKNMLDHPSDCTWLESYLKFEPFEEKKYLIEDFTLLDGMDNPEIQYQNGILLYEHLKDLPRYILCSERFWAWITFSKSYKQAISASKLKASYIKSWWLGGNSRRALMLGIISRYYFMTEISLDESNKESPFHLTHALVTGSFPMETYRALVFRNIGMIKNVDLAYLETVINIRDKYGKENVSKETMYDIAKSASKIGSVMLIDDMCKEEIYNILWKKAEKYVENQKTAVTR